MRVAALTGSALESALDDVARLRITVFAEWPYLYDGDLAYETRYLQTYRDAPGAILVGAFDGETLVGASTGTPLTAHADDFATAFHGTGMDLSQIFYCAESVLLPAYRGQGIGHRFFDLREEHARKLGYAKSTFCAVQRPADHPARPPDYRPLDPFWRARGYTPLEGVVAQFHWRDLGGGEDWKEREDVGGDENTNESENTNEAETPKPLQFWIRDL